MGFGFIPGNKDKRYIILREIRSTYLEPYLEKGIHWTINFAPGGSGDFEVVEIVEPESFDNFDEWNW